MHAESYPGGEEPDTDTGGRTPGDKSPGHAPETPQRRPIIAFFTRRAFFSKDTGRWHKVTGGRDHSSDEPVDSPSEEGDR